jgi:hypothetical protein
MLFALAMVGSCHTAKSPREVLDMINPANCPDSNIERQRLEALYRQSAPTPVKQKIAHLAKSLGAAVVDFFTRDRTEPRIRKYFNIEGQPIWTAYDPITRQYFTATSEREIRSWLEARYYQQSNWNAFGR